MIRIDTMMSLRGLYRDPRSTALKLSYQQYQSFNFPSAFAPLCIQQRGRPAGGNERERMRHSPSIPARYGLKRIAVRRRVGAARLKGGGCRLLYTSHFS